MAKTATQDTEEKTTPMEEIQDSPPTNSKTLADGLPPNTTLVIQTAPPAPSMPYDKINISAGNSQNLNLGKDIDDLGYVNIIPTRTLIVRYAMLEYHFEVGKKIKTIVPVASGMLNSRPQDAILG